MPTPVAALYARPLSPYLAPSSPPPSRSPALPPSGSPLPPAPTPDRPRPPLKRATLSLDPRKDDPFAAAPTLARGGGGEGGPRAAARGEDAALGGEEWRVSESLDRAQYTGPQEEPLARCNDGEEDRSVRRRSSTSSFLRSLARPLRSSTSSATAPAAPPSVLTKQPRRARSSVQLERISAPLPGSARGGSLRARGTVELISVEEAVERRKSWVAQGAAAEEQPREEPAPVPAQELRQSQSARSLGRRSSLGTLLFPRRVSAAPAAPEAHDDARAFESERPPTQSRKALRVLGGLVGSTKSEEMKGEASDVDETDVVGLALTTDAPTRRIVPDNARYSFATTGSSAGSLRSRIMASTTSTVTSPSVNRLRVASSGTQLSRHTEEDGEGLLIQASTAAAALANRPLSPPPNIPLPPLPNASTSSLPRINFTAPTPGTTPASHRSNSRPPLPPGLAPEPVPGSPPSPLPARQASSPLRRTPSRASSVREQPHPAQSPSPAPQAEVHRPPRPPRSIARSRSADGAREPHLHFTGSSSARVEPFAGVRKRPSTASTLRAQAAAAAAGPSRAPVSSTDVHSANGRKVSRAPSHPSAADEPRDPLASLYLVCGLPKEPKSWVEAEGVDGAPLREGEGRRWKAEVLGAKALKLAFDRDVEVVASPSQPPATTSFFSFTTTRSSPPASSAPTIEQRYHCVSLLVWSHSDASRAAAVAALLQQQQRATRAQVEAEAVRRAAKAARAGRKLSSQLLEQMNGEEADGETDGGTTTGAASETDTEGRPSFDLEDAPAMPTSRMVEHLDGAPLWLPYNIVLVSTSPLYTLLSDIVRLSWARYHQDLAAHSLQMERVLNTPTPLPGETLKVPVSVADEQRETFFVATMPGDVDWSTTVTRRRNFPLWPVFKALHADNLLTIAELALAPLGRIVFMSEHRIMLARTTFFSLATMAFQTILEMRDWKGLAFPTVHARDLKLFLEDPGPWLLGLPSSPSTASLLSSLAPEIILVDLDANLVSCSRPFPGAVSTGSAREKARRRLEAAVGTVGRNEVPLELIEAFPGGRFRPFSLVEVDGELRHAERLKPDVAWQWDEPRVLKEFDAILAEVPRVSVFGKLLRFNKAPRKSVELDANLRQVQAVVRNHATTFVERRDVLEAEVNKANRRLQILMNQSAEWQRSFQVFKEFSERASHESTELKIRLERERREARRLAGQLAADREHQAQLEDSLEAVERAREQALQELAHVDELRRNLEQQRAVIAQLIQSIVHGVDDETSPIFQAVFARIEALSHRSDTPSLRSSSALSNRPSSRLARQPAYFSDRYPAVIAEEDEFGDAREVLDEEARLEAMRLAFQETFRAISSRLSIALQAAGDVSEQVDNGLGSSQAASSAGTSSPSRSAESDATLVSTGTHAAFRPPPSPDVGPFQTPHTFSPTGSPALGFHPKPLTLTPPVSPELEDPAQTPASPFVTMRPQHRRVRSRIHGHTRQQSSLGAVSMLSGSSGTSSSMTPLARSPPLSSAFSTPTGATRPLSRSASQIVTSSPRQPAFSRSASALSQLSYISSPSEVETDDAQSFVSVSEGGAADESFSSSSRAGTPASMYALGGAGEDSAGTDQFELEELAHTAELSPSAAAVAPHRGKGGHGRQDSCAIDAPPVALFTRSGSLRSLNGSGRGGGGGGGAADLRGRVRAVVERYEQRA
ncbi:hypothetical protein JCM10449v2_000629 [Rhodotorula kratochvilovae]